MTAIIFTVLTAACTAILEKLAFFHFGQQKAAFKKNIHVRFILYAGFATAIILLAAAL